MTKCKILVRTLWGGDQLMFFSMTCTTDRTEYVKRLLYYLSFVINVYQNSEGYAGQSICQEKNHNILPLFCGTGKKQFDHVIKVKKKSLSLSVQVFSTAVLIVDTETNKQIQ